jgi:hypothetical protein
MFPIKVSFPDKEEKIYARAQINFLDYETHFSGLYYKHVMIVIDAPSVVKVTLQIVASLTIVIDDAS